MKLDFRAQNPSKIVENSRKSLIKARNNMRKCEEQVGSKRDRRGSVQGHFWVKFKSLKAWKNQQCSLNTVLRLKNPQKWPKIVKKWWFHRSFWSSQVEFNTSKSARKKEGKRKRRKKKERKGKPFLLTVGLFLKRDYREVKKILSFFWTGWTFQRITRLQVPVRLFSQVMVTVEPLKFTS